MVVFICTDFSSFKQLTAIGCFRELKKGKNMDEEDNKAVTTVRQAKAELSFLDKNPLTAFQKKLKSAVPKALKVMTDIVEDEEDKYSAKEKQDAAKFLLDSYVKVTDAITKDQFGRLVAEVKIKGLAANPKLKNIEDEEKPKAAFTLQILDPNKVDGDYEEQEVFDAGSWDTSNKNSL